MNRVAMVAIDLPDDIEADQVQDYISGKLHDVGPIWSLLGVENADEPWTRIEEGD